MPSDEAKAIASNLIGDLFAHLKRKGLIWIEDGEEYISVETLWEFIKK